MKKFEIMTKASSALSKIGFGLKKRSPEILLAAGIVGAVAGAVLACRATLKVEEIVDDTKEKMEKVHEAAEKGATAQGEDYSEEDAKKDTVIVYAQTAMKFIKLYAPAVTIGVLSITGILASNNILRKRNLALAAAYATVDRSFKEYRKRVTERYGEEAERSLRYDLKADKVTQTVKDEETGKEKKVKTAVSTVDPNKISGYARIFDRYAEDEDGNEVLNPHWEESRDYNLMHIKAAEQYANDLLVAKKRLFLNDVYTMLGFPPTKAGQVVGWVYNPDNPVGDNYVDFGPYEENLRISGSEDGDDTGILLDFNVDGNIWDLM